MKNRGRRASGDTGAGSGAGAGSTGTPSSPTATSVHASRPAAQVWRGSWNGVRGLWLRIQRRRAIALGVCVAGIVGLASRYIGAPELPEALVQLSVTGLLTPWRWRLFGGGASAAAAAAGSRAAGEAAAPVTWSWLATWLAWVMATYPVHRELLHTLGSAVVVPGQLRVLRFAQWALTQPVVQDRLGDTREMMFKLREMTTGLDAHRRRLLSGLRSHNVRATPWTLVTPDGAQLDALVMYADGVTPDPSQVSVGGGAASATSADRDTMTCAVLLNGNAQFFEMLDPHELAAYVSQVSYVVTINYRGFAASTGWMSLLGMAVDGATTVQFARDKLGIAPGRIAVIGHSIGGGVAGELVPYFPTVNFCSDRSFARIAYVSPFVVLPLLGVSREQAAVAAGLVPAPPAPEGSPPPTTQEKAKRVGTAALARFLFLFTKYMLLWDFDATRYWHTGTGFHWLLYNKADEVIPWPAQLTHALMTRQKAAEGAKPHKLHTVELTSRTGSAHNGPLSSTEMGKHMSLLQFAFRHGTAAAADGAADKSHTD